MKTETLTKQQALQTIDNIFACAGYAESQGDLWLGPRLTQIEDFIASLWDESEVR